MRTSTLSRSVMAVASLAIGAAALAAVPATAGTVNGVTRTEVLDAAKSLRADGATKIDPSDATQSAVDALAAKVCGAAFADNPTQTFAQPVETPTSVDGLAVTSYSQPDVIINSEARISSGPATCTFTAAATVDGSTTFSGESTVFSVNGFGASNSPTVTNKIYQLSGNVYVSPAVIEPGYGFNGFQAEGLVKSPESKRVLTSVKISDKKTKADKKVAKKAYSKRLKAIKKSYAKAKRRAGSNAEKKAVARMTYLTRKASAKSAYRYAVADYKLVNRRTKVADERRFSAEAFAGFFL